MKVMLGSRTEVDVNFEKAYTVYEWQAYPLSIPEGPSRF